ncbi:hypothetical protein Haur_3552 [Herpetosiphon aurantiacus DSM 785]|uniref:Uncharacterized protein n=1 Tax=Herpetosiphon aurantiacus (strain ATCC 23779 / DSM 785 / 114-95) TaxID=316274 RepID=A9B551_HERA2|nr:hypothetical protein Haur_3552 [Herpetosiphon aurantiacus DSM 785]
MQPKRLLPAFAAKITSSASLIKLALVFLNGSNTKQILQLLSPKLLKQAQKANDRAVMMPQLAQTSARAAHADCVQSPVSFVEIGQKVNATNLIQALQMI